MNRDLSVPYGRSHLTSGTSVMKDGYEYYTFQVAQEGFEGLARAVIEGRAARGANPTLAGWYTSNFRPDPSDIVAVRSKFIPEDQMYRLVLKIRRGHFILAQFLRDHGANGCGGIAEVDVSNGFIHLRCSCDEEYSMSMELDALPDSDPSWLDES